MLSVKNLVKIYKPKKAEPVRALDNVSIDFEETGLVFLLGKSGSGKSTLLNAIGGLDKFDSGEIVIKGKSSKDFTQSDFDSYRNTFIGFIFQEYNILENFTVEKNLAIAIELQGKKPNKEEINKLLDQVQMLPYAKRKPNQLSGGQKQRIAIARALIKQPEIIMADEPTGALDSNTGRQVMETLKELSKTKLVIIVSHDRDFAETYGDRIIELKDGKIISDVTKKEIVAQTTQNGIKIIDNNILYIKKGQEISDKDTQTIAQLVKQRAGKTDTFITFDENVNQKIKEDASINDEGNREKFVSTQKEDVNIKDYNGSSLKLIKSRLKFGDSFKMGVSSLKNKVGKLIFTIILSFLAFTIFGLVDTLSCWNRADSVYETMKLTKQTNVVLQKSKQDNFGGRTSTLITEEDIKTFQKKFPDYVFKGAIGRDEYNGYNIYGSGFSFGSSNNPLKDAVVNSVAHITQQEITKLGFEMYLGRMPSEKNEIALSKHVFENMKELTKTDSQKITDASVGTLILNISDIGQNLKVVGVVDDGTDWSKYDNMTEAQIREKYTLTFEVARSYSRVLYVSEEIFAEMQKQGSERETNINVDGAHFGYNIRKDEVQILTSNSMGLDYLISSKSSSNIVLNDNEIIMPNYYASNYSSDYKTLIEDGFYLNLCEGYDGDVLIKFKVVGTHSYGGSDVYMNEKTYNEYMSLYQGYSYLLSALNGSDTDKELIKYCENLNKDNISFSLQNSSTSAMDMVSSIVAVSKTVLVWVAVGFAVFASLLLMNFISTSITYKKREIGILRALGARGSDIFGIFLKESSVIALINFVLASVATAVGSFFINKLIINELGFTVSLLNFGLRQVVVLFVISLACAFLASLIPCLKISKKKPIDAINNR